MQTFLAVCYRVFLAGTAKCSCSIWCCGMTEPLRNDRTSPELSRLAAQATSSRLRVPHAETRVPGTHPCPVQAAGVGAGGAGSAPAGPVAFVAADSHRLLSDARPWRSFSSPGPPGSALGIRGGPGVQPEPRAAHAAAAWSQPPPLASSPIRPDFTTSESCPKLNRDRLLLPSLRSKPQVVIKLKSLSLICKAFVNRVSLLRCKGFLLCEHFTPVPALPASLRHPGTLSSVPDVMPHPQSSTCSA